MAEIVIEFNRVWKKFKKGEKLNSLRDFIPSLFRNALLKDANNGLKKQEFWALQDVSFEIKRGEVLGIIGPNGAGKSTILKLLSGILRPNKGDLAIRGRLSALIEVTAGFHPDLTGRENVYLNGTILGMKRKEIDKKFDEIVEFSGVKEFIDTPVKRYSSGMFSRLGFSVAAHMDPDIFLVDEVLSVGDIAFQSKCAQKMRELLNGGVTIVLVSHNLVLISSLSKRVILLNKGVIERDSIPEDVIPFYEELIQSQEENEFKKKTRHTEYKVRINEEPLIKISNVIIYNGINNDTDVFKVGEPVFIRVDYETREKIENPVFHLKIIRADGLLCCSSSTKDYGVIIDSVKGKNSIIINLDNIKLTPGNYILDISIWDKDLLNPYAYRREDVLKISRNNQNVSYSGVFLPEINWKIER